MRKITPRKIYNKIKRMTIKACGKVYVQKESYTGVSPRLSHVTYPYVGNVGDTVLSQCVRRYFNKYMRTGWNIILINKPVTEKTIQRINKSNALIIGGGGLFLPDTNENRISGWQWSICKEQLQNITVPVLLYSVGYNYFKGQEPSELFIDNLVALCEKARFIGLRNMGSVNAVKNLLPEELKEKVVYQPCTTTLIRRIYGNEIKPKKISNKVAINMAFDRSERRFGDKKRTICTEVARAAKDIENKGYEIVIVLHATSDNEIVPYMDSEGVHYSVCDLTHAFPMKVYEFYNAMHCVIGMRGHAQMIPFGLNCGILSLGTHDKMKWFLEDIEATDWYISLTDPDGKITERIVAAFEITQIQEAERTRLRLMETQNRLWEISKVNWSKIQMII
ncbi:polysaccharide pyruvyl transferase family protein [Bariatricus massiliensis]|uniref:Polysaccharide pyruvyl transferase family protein n=1 Tax=Bariatricus massiliensis TaxID=1745713 RepID=A0ABS8DDM6_9FIRM|nr:polysaccharide pyruvyl transferase family protein [Bariatricus massiliensis]MCB7302635.1 polysaccharide pyruvyl transferase family protein [Bariatricus massiliensis]MCB7373851.1 polysaccharide pyruvyl transferase family protein [Bariatricus massiliensis]MCB7386521.1 polysaccharide pyruvyl transferase family protein [Bariatricus massiliensis]MCB7410683.1 polysaccharide pyruvyl transferase family protein [Bariatricus massiliensis]MCQ5253479.1 polysaccharide pyruvyl transferase family protein 